DFESIKLAYPVFIGDLVPGSNNLNYREKSVLSPIKLYSQITRKSTLTRGRIGHFVMTGSMNRLHNYEFAEMAYGGTLSLFFQRGEPDNINKRKVQDVYKALQAVNPLLARYKLPKLTYSLVNYHVLENRKHIGAAADWKSNALFAMEDTNPQATDFDFKDLIIGQDDGGKMIKYSHPSLLALTFPHLFTTCTGHYSLVQSFRTSVETATSAEQNI
ncbi:hypothetical protein BD408DRAFT_356714, partial [Parasitella parasitica]